MIHPISETKAYFHDLTGYVFTSDQWVLKAVDARFKEPHQRLALLGDVNLKAVIVEDAYEAGSSPGDIDILLKKIGGNPNLARVGRQMGIFEHIIMSVAHRGVISDKIVATTVEALLGSIYLDSGKDLDCVRAAMMSMGLSADANNAI